MKFKLLTAFSVLLAFSISLLAHMPASWLLSQFSLPPQVSLAGVKGTLWNGQAQTLTVRDRSFGALNLGQVSWDFQLLDLFTGKAQYQLRFGRGSELDMHGQGMVGVDFSGPFAKDVMVSLPIANALEKVALPLPIELDGLLDLTLQDYRYQAPWCESANGTLVWRDANIITPLGALTPDFARAELTCQQNEFKAISEQNSTHLSSEFELQLKPDLSYALTGWFKPESEFPEQYGAQLRWVGTANPQGQYSIRQSGRL